MKQPPADPLVIILGATGTGKSKLAVDIASRFNGEIINADAVQMYKGLPIVTNKIPEEEKNGIRHHLLDQIGLHEEPWTVHQFVEESSRIIADINARGKLPVVVGGTSYYIYSLLFRDSTLATDGHGSDREDGESDRGVGSDVLDGSTEDLYAKLQEIDPVMASRWHPKDRRKIQRSLEIWLKSGRKPSVLYAEQASSKPSAEGDEVQSGARYNSLTFWLDADEQVLKKRLDTRVDKMVDQGLLDEVRTMRQFENNCEQQGIQLDRSKGIWVAIGYMQLSPWLDAILNLRDSQQALSGQKELLDLRKTGIEAVKSATRRYAKRQDRWIRLRFAKGLQSSSILERLYLLDGTDLTQWQTIVEAPAHRVVDAFLHGNGLPSPLDISERAAARLSQLDAHETVMRQAIVCEVCKKTLMSEPEWLTHVKSQSHKKVEAGIRKRAIRDAYLATRQNV